MPECTVCTQPVIVERKIKKFSFLNVIQHLLEERLRKGEPASGNGKTAEGIKRECRGRNEENGNVHIEMTSRSVTEFANKI